MQRWCSCESSLPGNVGVNTEERLTVSVCMLALVKLLNQVWAVSLINASASASALGKLNICSETEYISPHFWCGQFWCGHFFGRFSVWLFWTFTVAVLVWYVAVLVVAILDVIHNNNIIILHHVQDITNFRMYVTVCEIEMSFNFDTTVETTGLICFTIFMQTCHS